MLVTHQLREALEHKVRVQGYEVLAMFVRHYVLRNLHDRVFYGLQPVNINFAAVMVITEQDITAVQEILCM